MFFVKQMSPSWIKPIDSDQMKTLLKYHTTYFEIFKRWKRFAPVLMVLAALIHSFHIEIREKEKDAGPGLYFQVQLPV